MIVRDLLITLGFQVNQASVRQANTAVNNVGNSATRTSTAVTGMGQSFTKAFALMGGAAAAFSAGQFMVSTIASVEQLKVSLETVTGSAEAAQKEFDRLQAFAAATPFQLAEVADAFRKLSVMGLDPSERALRAYGDTASAMGKSLDQMVEAVADAAMGEFERLKEFGIKAKTQGNNVQFTFKGVTTTVKKNSKDIEKFLMELGETNFAGGMERQSKTLAGMWSTLKDAVAIFMVQVGEAGLLKAMKEVVAMFQESSAGGMGLAKLLGFFLGNAVKTLGIIVKSVMVVLNSLKDIFRELVPGSTNEEIGFVAQGLLELLKVVLLLAKPWLFLVLLFEDFVGFMTGKDSVIGDFVDRFRGAPGIIGAVADAIEFLGDPVLWRAIDEMSEDLSNTLMEWAIDVEGFFTEIFTSIEQFSTDAIDALTDIWIALEDTMFGMWNSTTQWIDDAVVLWKLLKTEVEEIWTGITDFIGGILDGIKRTFVSAINGIIDFMNGVIDAFNEAGDLVGVTIDRIDRVSAGGGGAVTQRGGFGDQVGGGGLFAQTFPVGSLQPGPTTIGAVNVAVEGSTNMDAEAFKSVVADGTDEGTTRAMQRAFAGGVQ